jgi:hypothetical protein
MTRLSLAMLALAAAALTSPSSGQGAPYWPWCSQYAEMDTAHTSCAFISWEQCMETVRGMGGYCYVNPYPPPPADRSAKAPAAARKRLTKDY